MARTQPYPEPTTTHRAEGKEALPRLRRSYIGSLSSRVGTIESRRGRIDALSDFRTIDAAMLCACVRSELSTCADREGGWAPDRGRRAGEWGFATSARTQLPVGHLGRRALARGFAVTMKDVMFLELKEVLSSGSSRLPRACSRASRSLGQALSAFPSAPELGRDAPSWRLSLHSFVVRDAEGEARPFPSPPPESLEPTCL